MSDKIESNLIVEMIDAKHMIIEGLDGKDYTFDSFLPMAGYFVITANYNLLLKMCGLNDGVFSAEDAEKGLDAMVQVIRAANKLKYPELNYKYITENFTQEDLINLVAMYLGEVARQSEKKRTKVTPKKPEAVEAGQQ